MTSELLTVSSKGQVVLPLSFRKVTGITVGTKLAAYLVDDMIILKPIELPTLEQFSEQLVKAREWASTVGYKEDDVNIVIKDYRKKKRG